MRLSPQSAALLLAAIPASLPAAAQTLVAHYELNEGAGATVCTDSSGGQNSGTYNNMATYGLAGSSPGCGTAVEFDAGLPSFVSILDSGVYDGLTSNISVSAWINPNAIPPANSVRRIFGNNNGGWTCGLAGDGLIFTTRFVQDYVFPAVPITPQAWNHVAFVFDANFNVTAYVDGVEVGMMVGNAPANSPNDEWLIGGFDGNIEFFDGLIDDVQIYDGALTGAQVLELSQNSCDTVGIVPPVGTTYCAPAVSNSTGAPAVMSATGSEVAASNNVTLAVSGMPSFSFAFFIVSRSQSLVNQPGGSLGVLCLGGAIGRYVGPGQIQQSGTDGRIELALDLTAVPQPLGFVAVVPGDSWNFQAWYRDSSPAGPTSNFTDGLAVLFQ